MIMKHVLAKVDALIVLTVGYDVYTTAVTLWLDSECVSIPTRQS